jgi:hypothetical protein
MSSLNFTERRDLEGYFGMSSGYVLDFSDRTFGDFVGEAVGIDIHSDKFAIEGTSKAKKLRAFWKLESDHTVGTLIVRLIDYSANLKGALARERKGSEERCREIAARLLAGAPALAPLKDHAKALDANHLAEQIKRIESSVETDPSLAIGTAKELIETCCKTILSDRGKPVTGLPDVPSLVKQVMKELRLVPDDVSDAAKGADTIKRLLNNLGTIGQGLAELRNLYGTGHGKDGRASTLKPRHAKLAVGAASTLVTFLFETHLQVKP